MLENIRIAMQGILTHKMRSFLTVLGIIIGIASIISIVSTIQGTNKQLLQNVIGAGTNEISLVLGKGEENAYNFEYESVPEGVPVLDEEVRQQLLKVDGVSDVTFYNSRDSAYNTYYLKKSLEGAGIWGIDNHYFDVKGLVVRTGRSFVDSDFKEYRKVAILSQEMAGNLFQESSALGKIIEIGGEPFIVVGVARMRSQFEPVINSKKDYDMYLGDELSMGAVYIPIACWPIVYQFEEPQNVGVKAKSIDDMMVIGRPCADILNQRLQTKDKDLKYRAVNVLKVVEQQQRINESTNQQLIWIASISLLVGGIGVMNIMLVSITERTREIGLKKAIGAKRGAILWQFLTEAAVLTSIGGALGVIAGIIMSQIISGIANVPVAISFTSIVGSVLFSVLLGIVFGFVPSVKAAKLNPIDALRHE